MRSNTTANGVRWLGPASNRSTPKCNLCEIPWLFVVSVGGRTGSTTVLNMLNAHPSINLAGENHGTMLDTVARWQKEAASGYKSFSTSMQRGPVNPIDVLCDEQAEYLELTSPIVTLSAKPSPGGRVVRGFKDIIWTEDTINMLDLLFPCNRKVFSVRANLTAQQDSQAESHSGAGVTFNTSLHEIARRMVQADHETGRPWRSFWLELPEAGFNASQFNDMLHWLGEDGCKFTGVIHANARTGASRSSYANYEGTWFEAAAMLQGTCSLVVSSPGGEADLDGPNVELTALPAAAHNFEGDLPVPPRPVDPGFANFAALFDRVVVVCYMSTCQGHLEVWPTWLQHKVRVHDGKDLNAKLGILNVSDHGLKVTMGHAAVWEELGTDGVDSILVLEDDYRPIQETVSALAGNSSTIESLRAFVNDEEWHMLRVAYIPHELGETCSDTCRCMPSAASPNVCQVSLPPLGTEPAFCEAQSMAAYAVHKRVRPLLINFQRATFDNLTNHIEPIFDATHTGNKSNLSAVGYFAVPIDTYFPATLPKTHYITPGLIVQQEKPLQLVNMTRFGAQCNNASVGTPLGDTIYSLSPSQLKAEAYAAVKPNQTKIAT